MKGSIRRKAIINQYFRQVFTLRINDVTGFNHSWDTVAGKGGKERFVVRVYHNYCLSL